MVETKDPTIRLFGRKIPLSDDAEPPVSRPTTSPRLETQHGEWDKDATVGKATEIKVADDPEKPLEEETDDSKSLDRGREASVNPKTPSIDEETAKPLNGKPESETPNSDKTLKKPDKLLPCPRCKSMETKFCYYNNYNVNQPRHFCKACQRYWTAGGTMRNVPVGAGRRKSKNSASYFRHITIPEALEAVRIEVPNGTHPPKFISNGRVLSFNLDAPSSDPVASDVINLAENKVLKKSEEKGCSLGDGKGGETCDNISSVSSIAVQSSSDVGLEGKQRPQQAHMQKINGFPSHISCLPGVPWPFVWNSSVPPPAFCPPGFPLSFYPAAAWNCGVPGPWNTPWFSPQASSPDKSLCADSKASTLGKHPRDGDMANEDNISSKEVPAKHRNGSVLTPKTLRIDDPSEAAKSSIWATLGIKNESVTGGSLFKTFQPKGYEKVHIAETPSVLQANPAALSRSLVFHETS